jgi:peptidoglycan hydrolase-like protein with peptidoglycan-binding domain
MPSSYGRSIAAAVFVIALSISLYAHAATTTPVQILLHAIIPTGSPVSPTVISPDLVLQPQDSVSAAVASTTVSSSSTTTTALIKSLYAELQTLEDEIAALEATSQASCSPLRPTRTLALGSTGSDVSALQRFLESQGYYSYPSITGYYGAVTEKAVAAFQSAHGISPVGSVGPITRAKIASLSGSCSSSGGSSNPGALSTAPSATTATSTATTSTAAGTPTIITNYIPSGGGGGGSGGGSSGGGGGSTTPLAPTLTLTANVPSVVSGGSATLTWSSANASSCSASGSWGGNQSTSGSQALSNITATSTYTLACTGSGGSISQSVTINLAPSSVVPDTTPPTAPTGLSGNAISQTQINLTWSASTDNVGVTGYKIYRNNTQVGTNATNSYSDTGLVGVAAVLDGGRCRAIHGLDHRYH